MKNSIYFLFTLVFLFVSCSQEEEMIDTTLTLTSEADSALKAKTGKVNVCHYDADTDTWKTLNINGNALEAHLNHGDVSLVDADGDGYVVDANECGVPSGDCDDTNAEVNPEMIEICGNEFDENCDGIVEECNLSPIYVDGSTIKCYDWANVGDTGEISGITYTIVDETILRQMCGGNISGTLEKVCTTKVTDMSRLFMGANLTDHDISSWDVSNVTDMNYMFPFASGFDNYLSSWDVSSVTDMQSMFAYSSAFNGDLSNWDVSSVTDMGDMFGRNYAFNQDLSSWDVSSVTDMHSMFNNAHKFNQDLSSWDVSSVTSMSRMFSYTSFNQDLSSWDVTSVNGCAYFSTGSIYWKLPKPNFTNCTP